jgi:hypothetical protein
MNSSCDDRLCRTTVWKTQGVTSVVGANYSHHSGKLLQHVSASLQDTLRLGWRRTGMCAQQRPASCICCRAGLVLRPQLPCPPYTWRCEASAFAEVVGSERERCFAVDLAHVQSHAIYARHVVEGHGRAAACTSSTDSSSPMASCP